MSTFRSIFFEPAKQHWVGGMGEKGSHCLVLLSEIVDIVEVKFVSFLRQPLQIGERFSVPISPRTLHTGELTGELSTAPVIYLAKLLLLSLAVFTVTVGAEE